MKNKGFTLIEILVVVAIIGVLSSVVLVGLNGARKQGRDARRIADLRQIQTGLELYFQSNGKYPATPANWQALETALVGAGIGVTNVPNDPLDSGGWNYAYCANAGQTQYTIAAYLEDLKNPALTQLKQIANLPCAPSLSGTPSNPACSISTAVTNKYCQTL